MASCERITNFTVTNKQNLKDLNKTRCSGDKNTKGEISISTLVNRFLARAIERYTFKKMPLKMLKNMLKNNCKLR